MARSISPALAHRVASRFIAIGGRLMLDPDDRFRDGIDLSLLCESVWYDPQGGRHVEASGPYDQRRAVTAQYAMVERQRPDLMRQLVQTLGKPTPNGWLVWGKC